jgi:7-cyano-7-deazaguanine synthase
MEKHVVISLSGGMDSSTLLLRCLKEYNTVTAISFDYGQKHRIELERAQSLVDYLNDNADETKYKSETTSVDYLNSTDDETKYKTETTEVILHHFPKIKYHQIQLNGLADLLDSALVTGGAEVPEGHYAEENMKATVVPNRNKIFASIIQAVALSVANKTGEQCDIAMGIHAGDHAIYPDCRQEFRDADDHAFRMGNWEADKVGYFTPYLEGDKFTILQDGEVLCSELGLDFDEVYKRTNTSYKPIWHNLAFVNNESEIVDCSDWFSDFKSASSVERVEAFIKLGRLDPVGYADETGPVSWDYVVKEVTKVLENHNN